MQRWTVRPAPEQQEPFDHDDLWCIRDLPSLGVVMTLAREGVCVWSRAEGRALFGLAPQSGSLTLGNIRLVAIGADGSLVWFDDEQIWRLEPGMTAAFCVVERTGCDDLDELLLSNNGEYVALVSAEDTGFIKLYSLFTGTARWERELAIDKAAFSPDGSALLWEYTWPAQSGSETMAFGVFSVVDGESMLDRSSTCWDEGVTWSADGRSVLVGSHGDKPLSVHPLTGKGKRARTRRIGVEPPLNPPPMFNSAVVVKGLMPLYAEARVANVYEQMARGLDATAAHNPHLHPDIAGYFRLRDATNELCSRRNGLEFAAERANRLSEEELHELDRLEREVPRAMERLRRELLRLREQEPQLLEAARAFWAEDWARRAARDPEDSLAAQMAEQWRAVIRGEADDPIFQNLL